MSLPHDAGPPSTGLKHTTPQFTDDPTSTLANGEQKHSSIDLSLELERQLELESSPPATPSASASSHSPHLSRDTLDPQILVHIISGLRKTVEDMTKERDDLLKLLESATTREASLQDTLSLMTEKATDYEEELSVAKKKMKEDEEAIALLRNKVEESRRGLMRLQAESRRQSVAPGSLDLSRAGIPGLSTPPSSSNKRASFTPLTGRSTSGNNHRRVSSISGDGNGLGVLHLSDPHSNPTSPLSFQDSSTSSSLGPPGSRRSLFLSRHSPPNPDPIPLPPTSNTPSPEVETLKKEIESLKRELSDTRAEMAEANEAKEASDTCVKALREYIAENQIGESSSSGKLPPPPTLFNEHSNNIHSDCERKAAPTSGWGFKLWKADNTPKPSPVITTSSSPPSTAPIASQQQASTPTVSAPFSRLGGFFSSRGSVSSTISSSSNSALQTNAATPRESFRDSISGHSMSVSDTSSVVEPASPEMEHHGSANVKVVIAPEVCESGGVNGMIGMTLEKDVPVQAHQPATVVG